MQNSVVIVQLYLSLLVLCKNMVAIKSMRGRQKTESSTVVFPCVPLVLLVYLFVS